VVLFSTPVFQQTGKGTVNFGPTKCLIMKYLFLLFCLTGLANAYSQQVEIDTSFELSNENGVKEIDVQVEKGSETLAVVFEGEISEGFIEVELVDPNGKRHGGFELSASSGNVVSVRSGTQEDRENVNVNSNSNSNNGTTTESETTTISVSKGGNTTSISTGDKSLSISSGDGQGLSISSDGGVSIIKSNYYSEDSKGAKGVMVESVEKPRSGVWVIRVKSKNATGKIDLVIDRD
jgi:hypothetical protein